MSKLMRKVVAIAGVATVSASFMGLSNAKVNEQIMASTEGLQVANKTKLETRNGKIPKYIFLFIGDGMSYPQIQSAAYYLGAVKSGGAVKSFTSYAHTGLPVAVFAQG